LLPEGPVGRIARRFEIATESIVHLIPTLSEAASYRENRRPTVWRAREIVNSFACAAFWNQSALLTGQRDERGASRDTKKPWQDTACLRSKRYKYSFHGRTAPRWICRIAARVMATHRPPKTLQTFKAVRFRKQTLFAKMLVQGVLQSLHLLARLVAGELARETRTRQPPRFSRLRLPRYGSEKRPQDVAWMIQKTARENAVPMRMRLLLWRSNDEACVKRQQQDGKIAGRRDESDTVRRIRELQNQYGLGDCLGPRADQTDAPAQHEATKVRH